MSGAVLLLPLFVFKACTGTTLHFVFNAALSSATYTFYMCDTHRPQHASKLNFMHFYFNY